jgi:hypothetical protein
VNQSEGVSVRVKNGLSRLTIVTKRVPKKGVKMRSKKECVGDALVLNEWKMVKRRKNKGREKRGGE